MPAIKPGTILPTDAEDAAITAAALSDADNAPLDDRTLAAMRPMRGRGRPAGSGTKVQVTVRFDADVIEAFKQEGEGWQSRMNGALREWLARRR